MGTNQIYLILFLSIFFKVDCSENCLDNLLSTMRNSTSYWGCFTEEYYEEVKIKSSTLQCLNCNLPNILPISFKGGNKYQLQGIEYRIVDCQSDRFTDTFFHPLKNRIDSTECFLIPIAKYNIDDVEKRKRQFNKIRLTMK